MMNLPYWSPTRQLRWASWWALSADFPFSIIPKYKDLPEIDAFLIYPTEFPELEPGEELEWKYEPRLGEDGVYYEDYTITKTEE